MRILDIEAAIVDSNDEVTRKLDCDFTIIAKVIARLRRGDNDFPLMRVVMNSEISLYKKEEIEALALELRKLPRLKQRFGLEPIIKATTKELLSIKSNERVRFSVQYSEHDVIAVAFNIYCGSDDPQFITDSTGLKPTIAVRKGELMPARKPGQLTRKASVSFWSIQSKLSENDNIEDHIKHLLTICRPHKDRLILVGNKYGGLRLSVGVSYYHSNPQLELSPDILAELSQYNASLWLDMYY